MGYAIATCAEPTVAIGIGAYRPNCISSPAVERLLHSVEHVDRGLSRILENAIHFLRRYQIGVEPGALGVGAECRITQGFGKGGSQHGGAFPRHIRRRQKRPPKNFPRQQKISGGFRCIAGATDFAVIRSFISTVKKQGWNVIQAIAQDPQILINSLGRA